jgi:WD40 repeat protein
MNVRSVVFSADGKRLAGVGYEAARLWEVSTGRDAQRLAETPDFLITRGLAFGLGGNTLILVDHNREFYRWDTATGKRLPASKDFSARAGYSNIAFHPGGKVFAAGTMSAQSVRLFDLTTGSELPRILEAREFTVWIT